jgi:uncharacterized delta-60 repeat protein/uncharacterized repeat protein (TIGR01451 family)
MRRAARAFRALCAVAAFCGGALKSQAQTPPANDNLANAQIILGASGSVRGTNINATIETSGTISETNFPIQIITSQTNIVVSTQTNITRFATNVVQVTNVVITFTTNATAPQSTIWYVWTAPTTAEMDFNTRNSTSTNNGSPLDTTLAIYTTKTAGLPATYANLRQVLGDVHDASSNSYPNTSRVDFAATIGTTYFIQVGSTNGQGYPVLNWAPSLMAGGFGFSTSTYLMSSLENWTPDGGGIGPSTYGFAQGTANARITVTRSGPAVGRAEVTLIVAPSTYQNIYETNISWTNIYTTNYSGPPFTAANALGFTNILTTNIASVNYFENILASGKFEDLPVDFDELTTETNVGVGSNVFEGFTYVTQLYPPVPGVTTTTTLNPTNFLTNFPCTLLNGAGTDCSAAVSNSDGTYTITCSNFGCLEIVSNVTVPSAVPFQQFTPFTNVLTFNDFQMSQDVYVQIYPILNLTNTVIGTNGGTVLFGQRLKGIPAEDFYTGGPEEPTNDLEGLSEIFIGTNGLLETSSPYAYYGLNSYVQLTLTNLHMDPLEDPDIVPPTITQSNAVIDILNYWGDEDENFTNGAAELFIGINNVDYFVPYPDFVTINFERYAFRCNKTTVTNFTTMTIPVQRDLRATPNTGNYTMHYTIDSANINISALDDNKFATVAGSDYAVPSAGQAEYDFTAPTTKDWTGVSGLLTFPSLTLNAQYIQIPIYTNGAVEFDQDIELQLYQTVSDVGTDSGATPPAVLGSISTARLTINFNGVTPGQEPGGGVDWTWNVDGQPYSQPPGNLYPGADSFVNAVAIDANGLAVIGGDFNLYNVTSINYVARLLANGFIDPVFAAGLGRGPNNFVNAVVIDGSGRIIIGGDFTSVNGSNSFHIARLLPSGALDTSFATGYGFNGNVYALALETNTGNILVGGNFTSFDTTNCNHITRLLPSGGMDTSFLPGSGIGLTNGTDQTVFAVASDSLGRVILGGNFTRINGTNWNHIARLQHNGALDPSFSPGFGADGNVLALAVQPDNSIILGGAFQNFNLISRNYIARLTPGGVLDTSFAPGTGFNDLVYTLVLQPADGNILVGGQFTSYNGTRRVGLARVLGGQGVYAGQGGWLDTSFMDTAYNQFAGLINNYYNTNAFNPNDYYSANQRNQVLAMGLQADGNIVMGGSFLRVGGGTTRSDIHPRQYVARIVGAATPGLGDGGLGNYPGNMGLNQNPYSVGDKGTQLYITADRVNGSLGPVEATLGTNTLPPSSSSATAADFGLLGLGQGDAISLFDTVWDIVDVGAASYGWRMSEGEYGTNNNAQTVNSGAAGLELAIFNDPNAAPTIYADLNLLNLNASGLLKLGGVQIPLGPAIGQSTAQLDIVNENFPTGTIGFSATNYNVLTGGTATITLVRTNGNFGAPSVTVNALNGTAQNGSDYNFTSTTENFANGATTLTFTLPIPSFSGLQSNKFFTLYLSSPTAGASLDTNIPPLVSSNTTVTLIDGNFQPGFLSFSSPTYDVLKPGVATISVARTGAALGQLSVQVGTSNGTALNSVNYVGVTNTLTWSNQDISVKTFTVQTLQDNTVEGAKTVNLFLTNAQVAGNSNPLTNAEALAYPSNAVLTILDTDTNGYLSFLKPNFSVFQNGGQATITVTRTGGTIGNETVQFQTYNLSNVALPFLAAVAGSNYGATNGVLSFPPGISSASFVVPVFNTTGSEGSPADRLVGLEIFSGSPTNIAGQFPQKAVLTILDPELHLNEAGSVDTTTQNGIGFDNIVNSLSLQPDASVLAGGVFGHFNTYPFPEVARLLPSGAFDTGFLFDLTGANGTVWQVLSLPPQAGQTDGNIMIVGDFTVVDSVNSPRIARLNLDGGLDTSFNPGSGADGTVFAIATMVLPVVTTNPTNTAYTTNYVIGGAFANYNGNSSSGVARVTSAGLPDPNFNLGVGVSGSDPAVHAVAITANNQILVGGDFTSFNNQAHHHLVQLNVDGSLDTNFAAFDGISSDINGSVRVLVVQPDGRILIGGLFTTVNGSNFNYIARLNSDGSTDTNFNIGVGCNNLVQAIALDDQLRILVGGTFTQASGVTRNGLTRLNPNGSVDPSINFGFGANGFVDAIVVQTNAEIDVGGGFSTFGGLPENNFARLYGGANAGNGSIQFIQQTYGVAENATNAIIEIQRLGGTFGAPSVSAHFTTSNGTALSGVNYTTTSATVSFPLGETFETVLVPVSNSTAVGPNLTVNLLLTNPPSNSEEIGPQVSATLIITNVNAGLEFAATGFNQSATAGSVAIPVIRVGNPDTTVSVTVYTGTNGTAGPFINYVPTTNVLIFYPGEVTNYWLIQILDSTNTFQDTTVDLEMDDGSNAIVASPSSATLTINSVLTGPGYLSFSQTNYTVSEGATNAVITVLRTNGDANEVTVLLTTSGGTAIPGVNYTVATATLVFPQDVNVATLSIPIIQLAAAGPNTTVNLTLSNPTEGAILSSPSQAVLTIVNDIAAFAFSSPSYFVPEAAGTVTLNILRVGPNSTTATVNYVTYSPAGAAESNGYAVPNVDYVPYVPTSSNYLTFPPGETLETISIPILQTTNVTSVESFQVFLTNASAGTQIGVPGMATVGIIGDVAGFSFATNAYSVGENGSNIVISVNRSPATTGTLSVHYATTTSSNDTAVANVDYAATSGDLTFLPGITNETIAVPILDPHLIENNKTFHVTLSSPTTNSYLVSPSTALVTITNVYVGLAFSSPNYSVSECAVSASIQVVRTGLTNIPITVDFSTANGSGIEGVNYDETNGQLTFAAGQTVTNFDVTPINNHIIGPDHTVLLTLNNFYTTPPPNVGGVQVLTPSTAVLDIQECNGAFIVASGTAFVSGSNATTGAAAGSGVLFSNETVKILLGLRDIAGGNTTNLVATLQQTNGITSVSGPVTYGTLIQNGPTVSELFTFTIIGSNGQNIAATLSLKDSANTNLGTVAFGFSVGGGTFSFTNGSALFLPENSSGLTMATNSVAPGYGYPSLIDVSGIAGFTTEVTVTLSNFGHSYPEDVDVMLESPNGSNSILMSHVGSGDGVGFVDGTDYGPPVTLTFDQTASAYLPLSTKLTSGTYKPTTNNLLQMPFLPAVPTNEVVPVSAPQSPYPYPANLSALAGSSPNGYWSLWAICDESGDSGFISNGWVLNISTGVAVENDADIGVTLSLTNQVSVSNRLTYLLTVTNYGPSGATNLVITDYLPTGAIYLSNSYSGPSHFANNTLTVSNLTLALGAGTAFDIYMLPTNAAYITNIVTALALEPDPNSNNMVTNVTLVGPQSAELALTLTGGPSPISVGGNVVFNLQVTNGGISEALNVVATLSLPPGFLPTTSVFSPSSGTATATATNANGITITWTNIGDLPSGLSIGPVESLTVPTIATTPGVGLGTASVTSSVFDPLKGPAFGLVSIVVEQPALSISSATPPYVLTWSTLATNYTLQGAITLPQPGQANLWINLPAPPVVNGQYTYTLPGDNIYHFFRLSAQLP